MKDRKALGVVVGPIVLAYDLSMWATATNPGLGAAAFLSVGSASRAQIGHVHRLSGLWFVPGSTTRSHPPIFFIFVSSKQVCQKTHVGKKTF